MFARCAAASASSTWAAMNAVRSTEKRPSLAMTLPERRAVQELHHEKRRFPRWRLEIEHANDVRVIDGRNRLGLAPKTRKELGALVCRAPASP